MDTTWLLILLLAGIIGGFLAGLLGIGGGIIYIFLFPIILEQLGVHPANIVALTIANSIFGILLASSTGVISHIRLRRFYWREVLWIGLPGTLSSVIILHTIVYSDWYDKTWFNGVVIILMLWLLYNTLRNANPSGKFIREKTPGQPALLFTGIGSGAIAALSGLGGGVLIIPALNAGFRMNIKKAKSISLGVISITSLALSLSNMLTPVDLPQGTVHTGAIIWWLILPVSIGAFIGTPLGVWLGKKLPSYLIQYIFAGFIGIVIIRKALELLAW